MGSKDVRNPGRREFLISTATLAGVGIPGFAYAAKPCPPPSFSVLGAGTVTTSCQANSGGLPALRLTSGASSGTYGWTFGQPFRMGDVPSGSYLTSSNSSLQADVRNRWSDGSVKFAVLSGVSSFSQGQALSVQLATTSTAQGGGTVAEPTSLDAIVNFSGGVTGTYALQSALGVNKEAWGGRSGAGRVRKILGPVMSEFHYYVPTNDAHVTVWFFVRRYSSGATEIETVVENGWLNVAGPTEKSYSITVTVGGTTRYSGSLAHLHHTRWSRVDWVGADPLITPSHDSAYLRSTRLVPNYTTSYGAPSAATLNGLPQPTAPFAQGAWPTGMGDAGGGGRLLNNWEALYVTSGDARAYNSTINHSRAAGRYGIHYRDENTGEPPSYTTHANKVYGGGSRAIPDVSNDGTALPSNGGTGPPDYYKSHALPFGYLPYLVTGRHSFRDQVEFQANVCFFASVSSDTFEGSRVVKATSGAAPELRGAAWSIRSIAAAIVCVPDGDVRAAQYRTHLGKTLGYYGANYTNQNSLGLIQNYETYVSGTTSYKNFMNDSFSIATAWAHQVATDQLGVDKSRADAFVLWRMKNIVGRMGTQSGYCFRDAATYALRFADADYSSSSAASFNSGLYADWATVYARSLGTNTCSASNALNGDSGDDPSILSTAGYTYWGLVQTALAFAVDLGTTGASDAWSRLISASNYAPSGFNNMPVWGVVPR